MVEVGQEYLAAGRLTAHEGIGTFKIAAVTGGHRKGGWLATKAFGLTVGISATLHFMLFALLYHCHMKESATARISSTFVEDVSGVFRKLISSRVLLSAAGMIILIAASPGFGTPLFYYQTNTLQFSKPFIGLLDFVERRRLRTHWRLDILCNMQKAASPSITLYVRSGPCSRHNHVLVVPFARFSSNNYRAGWNIGHNDNTTRLRSCERERLQWELKRSAMR